MNNPSNSTEVNNEDHLHFSTRIDSIRGLVSGFQLLQTEFHRTTKRSSLIERATHFINGLGKWTNFGLTWIDHETGMFEFGEINHEYKRVSMQEILDELIETGSFASALQLNRPTTFAFRKEYVVLSTIRSGQEIKGVFVGVSCEQMETNREFEFHFLSLALSSLGAAIRRVESTDKLAVSNENLGEMILKKVSESEEARHFAEATTSRLSDFFTLFHNEVYNSLNGVLGFAQLLMEDELSTEQKDSLNYILKSGEHLKRITFEAQRPGQLIDGILSVDFKSIDLRWFWDHFVQMMEERVQEQKWKVVWNASFPAGLRITLDEMRLRQVLSALIELILPQITPEPLQVVAAFSEEKEELTFLFTSEKLRGSMRSFDFTVYATLDEILKLRRVVESCSFGLCRSIVKFERWDLRPLENESKMGMMELKIDVSRRSKYDK